MPMQNFNGVFVADVLLGWTSFLLSKSQQGSMAAPAEENFIVRVI